MANLIKIQNQQEYDYLKEYLLNGTLPLFNTKSDKITFVRKTRKMVVLNNRIFIETNNGPLEYLEDFGENNKRVKIQTVHMASHRGRDALYHELKNKYYNI